MKTFRLEESRALWNRLSLDLQNLETIAQILDRGEIDAWRELYRLAQTDAALRERLQRVVLRVPLAFGRFWLCALKSLGEPVEIGAELPIDRSDI